MPLLGSLAAPLWRPDIKPGVELASKDHPRFVLFTTAVCKVTGAPVPSRFFFTAETMIRAEYRFASASLLRMGRPLEGELILHAGLPLLARLDVCEFAALVARECGRFAAPTVRRPYSLLVQQLHWSGRRLVFAGLRDRFPDSVGRIRSGQIGAADHLIASADRLQSITCRVLQGYHHHLSRLLDRKERIASRYQSAVLGKESAALQEKVREIASAFEAGLRDSTSWRSSLFSAPTSPRSALNNTGSILTNYARISMAAIAH
jgi:hypothetical protein